jgi:hypothetical protein
MRSSSGVALILAVVTSACSGSSVEQDAPAPAISTSAADNLIPGQLARGAALQTEIRSAGHDCNAVIRTFQQGVRDGESVWDAECEGGESFGVIARGDGTTDVLTCEAIERETGTACWEEF